MDTKLIRLSLTLHLLSRVTCLPTAVRSSAATRNQIEDSPHKTESQIATPTLHRPADSLYDVQRLSGRIGHELAQLIWRSHAGLRRAKNVF